MTVETATALAVGVWLVALTFNVGCWAVARLAHEAFRLWLGRTTEGETAQRVSKLEERLEEQERRVRELEKARHAVSRR